MITVTPVIAQLHGCCFSVYMFEDRDFLFFFFFLLSRPLLRDSWINRPLPFEARRVNRICSLSACFDVISITDIFFRFCLFARVIRRVD